MNRPCQYATCKEQGAGHDAQGWLLCAKHLRSLRDTDGPPRPTATAAAVRLARANVAKLHADGLHDAAIAKQLGYTTRTICKYRASLGLPPIPPPGPRCGTRWGYQQHLARSEEVCADCRAAQRAYDREYKRLLRAKQRAAA